MKRMNVWQKVLSLIVSLGMLMQLTAPLMIVPGAAADGASTTSGIRRTVAAQTEPAVLAHPLSIARTQTRYTTNSETTISYHITNNLPPTLLPDAPPGATITDTVNIVAGFVLTDDMNTLRDVSLTTTVVNGVVSDLGDGNQSGNTITWALPDMPPGQTAVVTFTLQTPAAAATFIELDAGAEVTALRWGNPISAAASPAHVIPDGVDAAYLAATVDADALDREVLWFAAGFAQDPLAAFSAVQAFDYDAYQGSLRGARGAIWGAAGNSVDRASALIAMLRAAGFPARYRRGTLSAANAQTLLASMFPAVSGVAGYIPAGTPTADPLNDPALIAIAQDHWWVEAYLPGQGWTDLDPTFPGAVVGQSFAGPGANDRIIELPDSLRHKLEMTLRIEQYNSFPLGGTFLFQSAPLSITLPVPQVAAKEIVLGHILETDTLGGLVFATVQHTYTPYFVIDDWSLYAVGEPYQDLLTNFPLGSKYTLAQWLDFRLTDPAGNVSEYERVVKDLLGADVRIGGGSPQISPPDDNGALVGDTDTYTTWILPNSVNPWVEKRRQAQSVARTVTVAGLVADILDLADRDDDLTPEEQVRYNQAVQEAQVLLSTLLAAGGLTFAVQADRMMAEREQGLLVAQYFATPRLFSFGSAFNSLTEIETMTVDLRQTSAATVVYPGQALSAGATANWVKGITESRLEGEALDAIAGDATAPAFTTYRIFQTMAAQGIEPLHLGPGDLALLGSLGLSPALYYYAAQALLDGKTIVIPSQGVEWQGETRVAFWQVDPVTGETIGVGDDGLHAAGTELGLIIKKVSKPTIKRIRKAVDKIYKYLVSNLGPALGGGQAVLAAADWSGLELSVCPVTACGIEQFFTDMGNRPIPLPPQLFTYVAPVAGSEMAEAIVPATAAAPFSVSVSPAASAIDVGENATFAAQLSRPGGGDFRIALYAPENWIITTGGSGQVTAIHPAGIAPGDYQLLLVAQSADNPAAVGHAIHTVTVNAGDDLAVTLAPEPNITVAVNEAQLPDAAFTADLHNRSTNPHTFTIDVSGLPASNLVLNGVAGVATAQVTLQPGERRQVGLYYLPAALPAPGTNIAATLDVTMDAPPLTGGDSVASTVPALSYPKVTLPQTIFAPPDGVVQFAIALENTGNAGGSFALDASLPAGWVLANLGTPVVLAQGATAGQTVELITMGGEIGQRYPLFLTVENGAARLTAYTEVAIVTPESERLFAAANSCTLNDSLGASLDALALAVVELEYWCSVGDCPLPLRDRAAAAGQLVVSGARVAASPAVLPALAGVEAAVAALSIAANSNAMLTAISDLSLAIAALSPNLCELEQHRVDGRFTPYVQAILLGDSASFSLDVTNQGTLTTTYAITVSGLPDGNLFFSQTIPPGNTVNLPIAPAPNVTGTFNLTANIVADTDGEVQVQKTTVARLNVVDKFVQVTQVIADPPFVETGVSSTTLRVEVANEAGVALAANAETTVFAPGGSQQFAAAIPLTILAGNLRTYDLTGVNTSGWTAGIYTITVNLLDENDNLIPDGSGYGYLSVGQALQLSQAVYPEVVAPGTVTVTTLITSEIAGHQASVNQHRSGTIYDAPLTAADLVYLDRVEDLAGFEELSGLGEAALGQSPGLPVQARVEEDAERPLTRERSMPLTPFDAGAEETVASSQFLISNYQAPPAFVRVEQDDPAWTTTGTWTNVTLQRASGGSHWRNNVAGSTAVLTFDGTWINLGFIADRFSGYAGISIDGASQGVIDLYRNEETPVSYLFDGLSAGTHTLTVTVQGSGNPYATQFRVQLDYADYGDGSLLPDGDFEQDDPRVIKSNGWFTTTFAGASGGSYIRASNGAAWFPFAGDSFTLQTFAYTNAGKARLFVNGVYLDTIDMFAPVFSSSGFTRTFSYDGFGSGPHILQVMTYQDETTIDKLTTPGSGPFINPNPPVSGVTRFEADHPSIRYNGVPFTQTASSWVRVATIVANRASAGEYIYSATPNDTVSFDFEGEWLGIGFATDRFGGQANIAIDGQLVETVDLYTRYEDTASFYFRDLGPGTHTVTITVLGTSRPDASGARVHLDFFDVWDGQPLAEGTFEEDSERLIFSNGWGRALDANASGGAYAGAGSTWNVTAWFPFTGDSFTYHGLTRSNYQEVELRLNGERLGQFDMYGYVEGPRAYSFDNLGAGPHVLEIRRYRNNPTTVDAVSSPAIEPAWQPPAPAAITRYEEDHPDMRYNGQPYPTMPQSWALDGTPGWTSSGGNSVNTSTAGNVWSFSFAGQWVNIGLRSTDGGADIRINGVSQGIFNPTGGVNGVKNFPFSLDPGAHTVEVEVISGTIAVDYLDVWQGETIEAGWYDAQLENEDSGLFHFSAKQFWRQTVDTYAYNGRYLTPFSSANTNIWFNFVGTDLTILGYQRDGTALRVVIDGVDYGEFDMSTPAPFRGQPFSLHFPDLGEGAHVAQVFLPSTGNVTSRIDAFEVNPDGFYSYMPEVKWFDTAPAGIGSNPDFYNRGLMSTIGIGDLNGDGLVELVAPATNGVLYVYRGDGQDAGGGSPLLWSTAVVGVGAEPALADLTGDGRSEIIVSGYNGAFAFTYDGVQLWHNPDVRAYTTDSGGITGWGGPTVGNLDLDPEPEIVIAASEDALYVLDHAGNTLWSVPIGRWPTVPVLADITGDGILDIIVAQEWELTVYDYFNGGQIVWTYVQTDTINFLGGQGAFGSPAVADLTGDGQPEIIINWGHLVEAIRADGTSLWRYHTGNSNLYRPSPITVADVTGDGRMNIVTASAINSGFLVLSHLLMVLDADGALVWSQNVGDTSASASGVAAQDLTGDGAWEIIWNGSDDGLLIIRGSDGKRLFNEPYTGSGTVMEYPTLGDVDGDGVADIVLGGFEGLFVFSHIGRWADSRPLWNQHNYHVTNINDDWSVPVNEPNSWELHNTYRTQTPDRAPAPSYQMVFTYTEGSPNVMVLTNTASISLTAAPPLYGWEYRQEWYQPIITTTFDSLLTGMQPGETRQVSAGTEVAYRLPGGFNYLTLPPLYVTAPGLGELAPAAQSVVVGGTAVFTLTLTNPGDNAALYSLFPGGLPAGWLDYPATVPVGPGETVVVPLTSTVPPGTIPDTLTLWLDVDNGSGGVDGLTVELTLFDGLALALTPFSQEGPTGTPLAYTLTISNLETVERTYSLTATGLPDVTLPDFVTVAGTSAEMVTATVVPLSAGPQPFTVDASTGSGARDSVDGVAVGDGRFGLLAAFDPDTVAAGPGATAVYAVTLTNAGDTAERVALSLDIPAGWTAELLRFGQPISQVDLPAFLFNSVELLLVVTPDVAAQPGGYPITLMAQSLDHTGIAATAVAIAEVGARGVSVGISPASRTVDPTAPTTWDVIVTNTGSVVDTFDLTVSGAPALEGILATGTLLFDSVTLAPGASQTVRLTVANLRFLLPGEQQFAVVAQSRSDGQIRAEARASFTVSAFEEAAVAWLPESKTVTDTLEMALVFVISNTGNVLTEYALAFTGIGITGAGDFDTIFVPPHSTVAIPVQVTANSAGLYQVVGAVTSPLGAAGSATADVRFIFEGENQAPIVDAGPDQQVAVNQLVQFNGSATDPDGDEIAAILWDFGDGHTASGTFTPTHTYTTTGVYTVTLTVTDSNDGVGLDSLTVQVYNLVFLPIVIRSP